MSDLAQSLPPCVLHEDEHLLLVNKPPGMNTHSPAPHAGEGIYDWLRNRESLWAKLGILQRLDRETSGVMMFTKTALANKSLNDQFLERSVSKKYLLATDRRPANDSFVVETKLERRGEKYVALPMSTGGEHAITKFRFVSETRGVSLVEAEPLTGKTHQIRVHAAAKGFPILGDTLYGGSASHRVWLHSHTLEFLHPEDGRKMSFTAPVDFEKSAWLALREAIIEPAVTTGYRMLHGGADGCAGWQVDRYGEWLVSRRESDIPSEHPKGRFDNPENTKWWTAESGVSECVILENGVKFLIRLDSDTSPGLFLDQRDNRRRILKNYVSPGFPLFAEGLAGRSVLNTFAYTCGFSVCAALAGAKCTSLDLSSQVLTSGKANFALNGLEAEQHDFIHGDTFDWLGRFAKKSRGFDLIILDPPTFSRSKERGVFQAEKDYGKLVEAAVKVLQPGGVLLASTNAAKFEPEKFVSTVTVAVAKSGRKILNQTYIPQPPDFPIRPDAPGYLKTLWLKIA